MADKRIEPFPQTETSGETEGGEERKENRMQGQGAMPISMATVGNAYTIKKISGNTEVRSHLKSMGFNEGTEVKVITQLDGDVIIHVKESRVAINKDQARHILV